MGITASGTEGSNIRRRIDRGQIVDPIGRLLRLEDVCKNVGLSKTKIYRSIKNDVLPFPKPIKIGKASRWLEGEIVEWKQAIAAAQNTQ